MNSRAPVRPGKIHAQDAAVVRIRTERNGAGTVKTLVIAGLIALQFALLACLYIYLSMAFRWYLAVSFALTLIACIYVLSTPKNGLSKAVWILFMLVAFSFGYILCLLSDERIFFRRARRRYAAVYARAERYGRAFTEPDAALPVRRDARYLYGAGRFADCPGTAVRYFPSGAQLFDDMLERLERAERFIFLEYFIVADGILLERMLSVLAERARAGVDVRMIFDDMGSHGTLSSKTKRRIRAAGIRLLPFNRLLPRFSVALNYRDHRKIVVADGVTAYSGGSNLADEYVNEKRMHGYWKDTGIRLDGPGAEAFALIFLRQWEFLTGKAEDYAPFLGQAARADGKDTAADIRTAETSAAAERTPDESASAAGGAPGAAGAQAGAEAPGEGAPAGARPAPTGAESPAGHAAAVIPYADGLDFPLPIGKNVYENAIASAQERVYLMTPYFIPDEAIAQLLANKARSGADVRILLPGIPDKALVYRVSRNNAEKLIEAGVKVYCMNNSFVHSKLLLTEHCAIVGSINFDLRSFYQQFECAVYTSDAGAMRAVGEDFAATFADCTRIGPENRTRRNIFNRAFAGVLQLFAPLM